MAITMQVTLRRVGQHAHLWADERTGQPWSRQEDAALSWLQSRYDVSDLSVILSRTTSSIEERQQQQQQLTGSAITPAPVTFAQSIRRAIAAMLLSRERASQRWTAEEDAALRWLAERYSLLDLQVILRKPSASKEQRLVRLGIDHPGLSAS
jgi:hypothetical protein